MVPENLRKISNPYQIMPRLDKKQFVGRENEIEKFKQILEQYRKTAKLRNVIIRGNKSIGKSTLLHRYKQLLENYNFIVYEVDIGRDSSIEINEFEFFKDLINELFEKYGSPDGDFFDNEQCEIWFSLTSDKFNHSSDFKDRKIRFATQYANYKNGIKEIISIKTIEKDFDEIIGQIISEKMDFQGLAILIDEFQELSRNFSLLDILRQLSERLTGLIIIGSGLPTFLDNAIFEKIMRTAEPIHLQAMNKSEVFDLIYKPLEEHYTNTRFEMRHWFDIQSLIQIIERGGGNPLHITILCQKMLDYYQKNPELKVIELNKNVMEEVMAYYSSISKKSERIRLSLQSCSKDELKSFSLIYRYSGFSIRAAIQLEIAFKNLTIEEEEKVKNRFLGNLRDIWDLNLFVLNDNNLKIQDIEAMSSNALSNIQYEFIGNSIDKLYASYFYEGLTDTPLIYNDSKSFEDALASKLADDLFSILCKLNVPQKNVGELPIKRIDSRLDTQDNYVKNLINDLDKIKKTTPEEINKDIIKKDLKAISEKHSLSYPAFIAHFNEFEGYLVLIAEVNVRGKDKLIVDYFPVFTKFDQINEIDRERKIVTIDNSILNQYVVNINSIVIYWLPKESLDYIRLLDLKEDNRLLIENVSNRNFPRAVEIAELVVTRDVKLLKDYIAYSTDSYNNFGFCLINIGDYSGAKYILERCCDNLLISKLNMAYIHYIENNLPQSKNYLKNIVKKQLGKNEEGRFLHLTIKHPKLPIVNIIIENVSIFNVAAWNMALISCQENDDQNIVFSYLKKTFLVKENEKLIDIRVRYWIDYFLGNVAEASQKAIILKNRCAEFKYLYNDVCKDIEIFTTENNALK